MLIKFICCDVFTRIACDLVSKSPHIIDLEFLPMLAHNEPELLNRQIQGSIDKSVNGAGRKYDAVILGYGLCGNSVVGISCPIPLVIPRAHDCCTIHMGCRDRFLEVFGDILSARWSSTGYFERCHGMEGEYGLDQLASYKTTLEYMGYVEKFGEEDAEYIWETMHPAIETDEAVYIRIGGFEYSGAYDSFKSDIERVNKKLVTADGDISMLKSLIDGEWDDRRFLVVPPGKRIIGVYDMDYVMKAGE